MRLRQAARVVLLKDNRLLLFKVHDPSVFDPTRPVVDTYWVTVGGSLEPGETFEDAARREVWEETGLEVELGPWVWVKEREMRWGGELIRTYERYFLGRVSGAEVVLEGLTEQERGVYRSHRWWSLDELRASEETVFPEGLPDLLENLLIGHQELPVVL